MVESDRSTYIKTSEIDGRLCVEISIAGSHRKVVVEGEKEAWRTLHRAAAAASGILGFPINVTFIRD